MYEGIAASGGIGIGRVMLIKEQDLSYEPKRLYDTATELKRYKDALDKFAADTELKARAIEKKVGAKEAEIIRGHIIMAKDPLMQSEIDILIGEGECAESYR